MENIQTSDNYEIIDQAISLDINFKFEFVEAITKIRIKINDLNSKEIFLNLMQPEIKTFKIHTAQLYNQSKNKVNEKKLDKNLEFSCDLLTPSDIIIFNDQTFLENTPRNMFNFEEVSAKVEQFLNQGEIKVKWGIKDAEKHLERLTQAYSKGWKLFFTLEFLTQVQNPVGCSFFQVLNNKMYFIKDSSFGSGRSLFPCQDAMHKSYYFSTLRVSFSELKFTAVCSGNLQGIFQSKTSKSFEFKIDRKANPSFLGIIVGELYEYPCTYFVTKLYSPSSDLNATDCDKILSVLSENEHHILAYDKENTSLVLLPGIFINDLNQNPLNREKTTIPQFFYYNYFLVNQELFLFPKFLELNHFIIATFLKAKFLSKVVELLQFVSEDFLWILIGAVAYIDDAVLFLVNGQDCHTFLMDFKRASYFKLVARGGERYTLSSPHFFSSNQAFHDAGYILKCNLTFICLGNFLKLNKQNYKSFYSIFAKRRILTYDKFKKSIIKRFLLPRDDELEDKLSVLLHQTGTIQLEIGYKLFKKDSKMEIDVHQSPINKGYLAESNQRRFDIESYHSLFSNPHLMILETQKKFEKLVQETEGIKKEEMMSEKTSIVLANAVRKPLRKVQCTYEINLIEDYKEDSKYDENLHRITIEQADSKHVLPLKSRFRRNYNKKPNQSKVEAILSTTNLQEGTVDNKGNNLQVEKDKESQSEEDSENVTFKIIPDPKRTFLFDIICKDSKSNLVDHLKQAIERRESLGNQMDLLQYLLKQNDKHLFAELCDFLNKKGSSNYLKISILQTLRKSIEIRSEFRVIDVLMDIVQTSKFEKDGTIRQNKFENVSHQIYFLEVIKSLVHFDKKFQTSSFHDNFQKDAKIVKLVLDLVKKNENSINSDDSDSFYQAFLLKILMKSSKSFYFDKICKEVLRYLKTETYNNPLLKFAIVVIFRNFATFIHNNMSSFHFHIDPSVTFKFASLPIFLEHENLKAVLENFEVLRKRLRTHPLVCTSIFAHKLACKRYFNNFQLVDLLIFGMKYVNKEGTKYGSLIKCILLFELVAFVQKNRAEFQFMQKKLILKNVQTLSDLMWTQLNCGTSLVDPRARQMYVQIYEILFDEFIPICYVEKDRDSLFPVDHEWLNFTRHMNADKYFLREKKLVSFGHLSMQKKTKKGQIVAFPQDKQYDIRELLRQNFKTSKETPNTRNMMKNIVNTILNEKHVADIETSTIPNEQFNYNPEEGGLCIRIKHVPHSMKKLKDKLETLNSLEDLRRELHAVLVYFKKSGYFDDEIYLEEKQFVDHLVTEGKRILREKREKEETAKQGLRVKLPGLKRTKM